MVRTIFLLVICSTAALAYTGDDKFIKKYAMMKVYESCFGQEVVKEVRKEMKAAAAKCAGVSPSGPASNLPSTIKIHSPPSAQLLGQRHKPQIHPQISGPEHSGMTHAVETATHVAPLQISDQSKTQGIDLHKLQQAILAGYNKHLVAQQQQHSFGNTVPDQQYRPFYQPPAFGSVYYPQPNLFQPQPPQPQYVPNPYYQPPVFPYNQPYYRGQRGSRDLDIRGQLETLATHMSGKVRNVTCIMQELGYLDANLEPDYTRMIERIGRLPVHEDLKKDMIEGVDFCRQFSQCLPEDRKDKLVREMVRPMFFFRCYKHKKLEACIMKDVRERYSASEEMAEDNLTGSDNRSAKEFPDENMTTAVYEFLYGDENSEVDALL